MKANELRIGNVCFVNDQQELFTVESISKDKAMVRPINNALSVNGLSEFELNALASVPISEDLMIKFGFNKLAGTRSVLFHKEYTSEDDDKQIFQVSGNNKDIWQFFVESENEYRSNSIDISLHSAHKLQNLYFEITSQELTIEK